MNKLKSFFVGIILLIIVFAMVTITALVYRANERSSIKSYIFQMGNGANQRVGELQNIENMSEKELKNKLIKKYVSEYFKVIPGETNVEQRRIIKALSSNVALEQWKKEEAKNIADMATKQMFRMARVNDNDIMVLHRTTETPDVAARVYYMVQYTLITWPESNAMDVNPIYDQGTIYLETEFAPGLRDHDKHNKKINIKKYLESNEGSPVELFWFRVTNVGSKAIR